MAKACPPSFESVSYIPECPLSKQEWEERAVHKNCSVYPQTCQYPLEYHCLLNAYRNKSIEVCAPKTRLIKEYCPAYSLNGQRITDQYNCSAMIPDCPEGQYWSNEILNYKGCLKEVRTWPTESSTIGLSSRYMYPSTQSGISERPSEAEWNRNYLFLLFLLLIPVLIFGIRIWRKKKCGQQIRSRRWGRYKRRNLDPEEDGHTDTGVEMKQRKSNIPQNEQHTSSRNKSMSEETKDTDETEQLIPKPTIQRSADEIASISDNPSAGDGANSMAYRSNRGIDEKNIERTPEVTNNTSSNLSSTAKSNIDEESITNDSSFCTKDAEEKENTEMSEKNKQNAESSQKETPNCDSSSCLETTNENQLNIQDSNSLRFKTGRQQSPKASGKDPDPTLNCNDANTLQNDVYGIGSAESVKVQSARTSSLDLSSERNRDNQATRRENNTDKNNDQIKGLCAGYTQREGFQSDESYLTFERGLNATVERGLDTKQEMDKDDGLQEEIGDLSKSFSSAFPESIRGDTKTVTTATSTETCEGRESSINDNNQLQHTLSKMLPLMEKLYSELHVDSKSSDEKKFQQLIDNQSWTPAQQREIGDIRKRINNIEHAQNKKEDEIKHHKNRICILESETKSLKESISELKKRLLEKSDENHNLKTELKDTKNALMKKEEELLKAKQEKDEMEKCCRELRDKIKELREKSDDTDDKQ